VAIPIGPDTVAVLQEQNHDPQTIADLLGRARITIQRRARQQREMPPETPENAGVSEHIFARQAKAFAVHDLTQEAA
jgi:hypothetical protein